jgi:hypothetical protein
MCTDTIHLGESFVTHWLATIHNFLIIRISPSNRKENSVSENQVHLYEVAGGDIDVWVDPGGAICLKVRNKVNDPVELAEHEAMELAELLIRLVKEQRGELSESGPAPWAQLSDDRVSSSSLRLPGVERLELAPFSRAELAQRLEAITGRPLSVDQLERIYARSEGNPFYAEQLLAARADVGLPSTLADVLLARIQALSGPAQQVLRVAAVAGRGVPHRLLAEVAGWPETDLEQGLRAAIEAGVLVTDSTVGAYAFRHRLLQEAVYGNLLPSEQVRLHAGYPRVLASQPDGVAAELAHHCLASNDHESDTRGDLNNRAEVRRLQRWALSSPTVTATPSAASWRSSALSNSRPDRGRK